MAHRANVTQVGKNADQESQPEPVVDPICGMRIDRRTARHMLFRPEATYYFCSKECEQRFMHGGKR